MELLTHSRTRLYRECARKHDIAYRQGIRPVKDSDALRFGTLIHKGLEAFWKGEDIDAALAGEADPFEHAKAEELMRGYIARYSKEPYEVLAVEQAYETPLLNPATFQPSRTYRLGGKLDLVLKVIETGRVCVVEHKTTADMDEDYWARLQIDHQISHYVLGAESLGFKIEDTLYDVIKKPGIRPLKATPPEARKYTGKGFLYANQREADETPEEYAARLRADIEVDPDKYFQQRLIPRLHSQIQDFMYDVWSTAREIREAEIAGRSPRNPEACLRYGRCPYWDICINGMIAEEHPERFRKIAEMHEELRNG